MTDRIVEISQQPGRLYVRKERLLIEWPDYTETEIPLVDLGVLIVSHPRVQISPSVLSGIVRHGGAFLCCDEKHLPSGMLLPLQSHYKQAGRLAMQTGCKVPKRKQLWQQIVRAKINAQAQLLIELHDDDAGLKKFAAEVKSGDTTNREAVAAKCYWHKLFGTDFRRNPDGGGLNLFLNYGYAVLRALTARAICGAGLHPSIGLHHSNQLDAFCLADDLMEPLRPIVDHSVFVWQSKFKEDETIDRDSKAHLIGAVTGRIQFEGEDRSLEDAMRLYVGSLVSSLEGTQAGLRIPQR